MLLNLIYLMPCDILERSIPFYALMSLMILLMSYLILCMLKVWMFLISLMFVVIVKTIYDVIIVLIFLIYPYMMSQFLMENPVFMMLMMLVIFLLQLHIILTLTPRICRDYLVIFLMLILWQVPIRPTLVLRSCYL